jgi:hypothetical protein
MSFIYKLGIPLKVVGLGLGGDGREGGACAARFAGMRTLESSIRAM